MNQLTPNQDQHTRTLLQTQDPCPPGHYTLSHKQVSALTIALASVSGGLLVAGVGTCVFGMCRKGDSGKKIIPMCIGSVLAIFSIAVGIAAAIYGIRNAIDKSSLCWEIKNTELPTNH